MDRTPSLHPPQGAVDTLVADMQAQTVASATGEPRAAALLPLLFSLVLKSKTLDLQVKEQPIYEVLVDGFRLVATRNERSNSNEVVQSSGNDMAGSTSRRPPDKERRSKWST